MELKKEEISGKMRILMLVYNVVGKGTYWRALFLARGLAQRGHTVNILVTSRSNLKWITAYSDTERGVSIIETPDLLRGSLRSGWDIWNVLSRIIWSQWQEFDVIHAFETRPVVIFPALYWKYYRKKKLVLDWCDWFGKGGAVEERENKVYRFILRIIESFFEEKFRKYANTSTVINSVLYRKLVSLGIASKSILLLPNGCNIETIYPIPMQKARQSVNLPEDDLIIGYIGSAFPRDAYLMAQSFNMLLKSGLNVRLLLIGYFNINIEKWINDPNKVIRTGKIPFNKINQYLSSCNIGWLILNNTGANRGRSPLKLSDYMSAGLPIVATNVGDILSPFYKKQIGLIVTDKFEDIAEKTAWLFDKPDKMKQMRENARFQAVNQTWDTISSHLEKFYGKTITGRTF